jgi:hypothetical protein
VISFKIRFWFVLQDSVSYDKPVVIHEVEPPASSTTAAAKLGIAGLLHKEVNCCCIEELLC